MLQQPWNIQSWLEALSISQTADLHRFSVATILLWRIVRKRENMQWVNNRKLEIQCLVWWAWKLKHFRHVMVEAMLSWHTLNPLVAAQHRLNTGDYQSIVFCMCPSFMAAVYASADGWFQQHTVSLQSRMKIWRFMYKKAPVTLITARLADCCVIVWVC